MLLALRLWQASLKGAPGRALRAPHVGVRPAFAGRALDAGPPFVGPLGIAMMPAFPVGARKGPRWGLAFIVRGGLGLCGGELARAAVDIGLGANWRVYGV